MKKYEHLPVYGIGPVYVISILLLTVAAVLLRNLTVLSTGRLTILRIPLIVMGILFIILFVVMWIQAVIISKLDENIKKNHLVTSGVYAWVRNPVYSAFMLLCTGVFLIVGNAWLLILPFIYWWMLTVLIKHTEEKWLIDTYGNEYIAYCREVNRCWPWIPRELRRKWIIGDNMLNNSEAVKEHKINQYLQETEMLDFSNPSIQNLIEMKHWKEQNEFDCIKSIYNFVKDDIPFGYNVDDNIPASKVVRDGYGQCNTKGTLFMALLRACEIPCRIHGFTIDKRLQKGAMRGLVYKNAPRNIFHSWVEVYFENTWYELEAFILDRKYLSNLQKKFASCSGSFCGYGVAVKDFRHPVIDFDRNNTYIQSEGITQDFGVYDSPDELLKNHHQEMSEIKAFTYRHLGRHLMNRNIKKIRNF